MNKFLSGVLASTLLLSTIGTSFAQENSNSTPETQNTEVLQEIQQETLTSGSCGDNAFWSYNSGTLTISGTGAMYHSDGLGVPWTPYREDIKSVVIEDGITTIGYRNFYKCTSLTSITIPNSVTTIGTYVFELCTSLTSITIPNSVTKIGWHAFEDCTSLTSINIPNSVTEIGSCAFDGCSSLTSINIPNSVTYIGGGAFSGCTSLTSITIPNSVTEIGFATFRNCTSLTSVTIPNSVTTIESSAFSGCTALASITIPNSVTTIESSAFSGCTSLASITIPNSVTTIESNAFWGCESLTSITIPNSVTEIGWSAFEGCSSLASINIPNSVTSLGGHAFEGCSSLASINIPNSVTSLGGYAFSGCTALTSINIPNSVTEIGGCAFLGCESLTSITIPNSVTEIGYWAFRNCTSLTSVFIPDSVKEIGELAFHTYDFNSDTFKTLSDVTVYGYAGSYAETWCKTHSSGGESSPVPFVAVTSVPSWAQTTTTPSTPTTPEPETPIYFTLNTGTSEYGTITPSANVFQAGERVTFKVTANSGFLIESVSVVKKDGSTITCGYDWTEGCYAFIMPSETVDITVNFIKIPTVTYTTQLNQTTGGNFSVSTTTPQEGDEVTITTNPNSGYSVSFVTVYTTTGERVPCINMGGGVYVYKQPSSSVSVKVTYQNTKNTTESYTDVSNEDWYAAYVAYVTEHGYMNGTGDGLFGSETPTTRGMVALILALASGDELTAPTSQEFPDVPLGQWYTNGVAWCKENGIVSGYENGNFGVDDPITKEQMVLMMQGFAKYQGKNVENVSPELLLGYADGHTVAFWAENAYAWALTEEYLQLSGNILEPQSSATRAEFANILNLFLENNS